MTNGLIKKIIRKNNGLILRLLGLKSARNIKRSNSKSISYQKGIHKIIKAIFIPSRTNLFFRSCKRFIECSSNFFF